MKQLKNDKFSKIFLKNVIDTVWDEFESKQEDNQDWLLGVKYGLIYERNSDEMTKDKIVSNLLTYVRILGFVWIEMNEMKEIYRFMIDFITNGKPLDFPNNLNLTIDDKDVKFVFYDIFNIVILIFEMCHKIPRVEDLNDKIAKRLESYSLNEQIINVDMMKEKARQIYEDKQLKYVVKSHKLKTIYNMLEEAEDLEETADECYHKG